jgi:hypothetical protein
MPNGLVRLCILFPWLAAFVLFVKKERCDRGDKAIMLFILAVLLLDAPTWLGKRIYGHYFMLLSLPALLAYAFVAKYAARLSIGFVSGIQKKHPFIRTALCCSAILFIGVMSLSGVLSIADGIKSSRFIIGVPTMEKDATICEMLNKNDRRLLVIGNTCFLYRHYGARPDCKYLYQDPIAKTTPVIWEELLKEVRSKKTPLILVPDKYRNLLPVFFSAFIQENYRKIDCLNSTLFVYDASERQQ